MCTNVDVVARLYGKPTLLPPLCYHTLSRHQLVSLVKSEFVEKRTVKVRRAQLAKVDIAKVL